MYLGIDLGTSNSAVATVRDGRVVVFRTPENTEIMPSVIHTDRRGNRMVGVRAYDQAILSPENVVQRFKRLMGTSSLLRFAASGQDLSPEDASAEILRTLVGFALLEAGESRVSGAVITIPAAFNQLQREATLAAARAAGLDRVGLLQEPVAAALASMANSRSRSGQFLVYDLGGGTLDLALVQAVAGSVEVVAHEGINMLGGTDFDRALVDHVVRPWLAQNFALPSAWQTIPRYQRLARVATLAAERAKIELSTRTQTSISASDDIVRLEDEKGEPIYLDAPLSRAVMESLVAERISQSISLCRKIIANSGYAIDDIERVVLIGGPTKMPVIRARVEAELGIAVEDPSRVDPMTAVAIGAAIYCESQDWSRDVVAAKSGRAAAISGEAIQITYDYDARSASPKARLRITRAAGPSGCTVMVDSEHGVTTGRLGLDAPIELVLDLPDNGSNRFSVVVFDPLGRPVADAGTTLTIQRVLAVAGGVGASKALAVKIENDAGRGILAKLIEKGQTLPAKGARRFRSAQSIRAGSHDVFRIEIYELDREDVLTPEHNLMVGEFRIRGTDLPDGSLLRRGDEVIVIWTVDIGQTMTAQIEIPRLEQIFGAQNFYSWQMSLQSFDGEEGGKLAADVVDSAADELDNAENTLPANYADQLRRWRLEVADQKERLSYAVDADLRKQVADQARALRQSLAASMARPDARALVLSRRVAEEARFFDRDVRGLAADDVKQHADLLANNARESLAIGTRESLDHVERVLGEMDRLYWQQGYLQFEFCARYWKVTRGDRHRARDRELFDRILRDGEQALQAEDIDALRKALWAQWGNLISRSPKHDVTSKPWIMGA